MRKKYFRNIIFSKTPLKGFFKFHNEFQIFPCDFPNLPNINHTEDFPLIIEYWIDEDENQEVLPEMESIKNFIASTTNQTNKLNRITRLLTAITNHRIFQLSDPSFKWGLPLPPNHGENPEELDNTSSCLNLGVFAYPGMANDLKIDGFSEQRFDNVKYFPHHHYYTHDPIDSKKKEIAFPASINTTLEKYYSLEPKTQKIIDSICLLIFNGIELKSKMRSLSFISFVSSIETIVDLDFKSEKLEIEFDCDECKNIKSSPLNCNKCGRPIWGISAKFKLFLKRYVATSEEAEKKFKRVYNLRSKIVHSGMLLLGDYQIDWSRSDRSENEWIIHAETMQLSRLAMVHWLLSRK
jgi:hypothetical protein